MFSTGSRSPKRAKFTNQGYNAASIAVTTAFPASDNNTDTHIITDFINLVNFLINDRATRRTAKYAYSLIKAAAANCQPIKDPYGIPTGSKKRRSRPSTAGSTPSSRHERATALHPTSRRPETRAFHERPSGVAAFRSTRSRILRRICMSTRSTGLG